MNNKVKVLIGDDTAIGVSIANKLREKGIYAYTRRKDCGIIVESIKNDPPDAAVLDITAHDGDAVMIMKKVRDLGVKYPAFIVTSDIDNEFIERQVMENGGAKFLLKPYDADDLFNVITSALGNRADSISDDMRQLISTTTPDKMISRRGQQFAIGTFAERSEADLLMSSLAEHYPDLEVAIVELDLQ